MISPLAFVPRAIHVLGVIVSLMNLTPPSANRTLTPPGWLLWALEKSESSGVQPAHWSLHEFHGASLKFGGATVLNRVIAVAPQPQRLPLAWETLLGGVTPMVALYAWVQSCIAGTITVCQFTLLASATSALTTPGSLTPVTELFRRVAHIGELLSALP